jgi:hypothetical protein
MKRLALLLVSHAFVFFAGFVAGIYVLPILTAPNAPSAAEMAAASGQAEYSGEFRRDLEGSDFLHWGAGIVSIGRHHITLQGKIAPGPDYKLYLSPGFVETEAEFVRLKPNMVKVGDVRTFENFIVPVPDTIDPSNFNTVIVWCESFGEFITSASYM